MIDEFIVVQVVPTGIGAAIGGYVGDATPATNLLAGIADRVIAHPNVVNGVTLDVAKDNVLYVEGFMLDRFFRNEIALHEVRSNSIGVVLDSGVREKGSIDTAINTIDAVRTVKGVDIVDYTMTRKPVNGRAVRLKSGAFVGEIRDPNVFLEPCKKLIGKGATAIAIATQIDIEKKDLELYFRGKGPNPYGGTEALISHAISWRFGMPAAHAPLLTRLEVKHEMAAGIVDPRAGAEAITPAYLGCVLQGLHRAPQPVHKKKAEENDIRLEEVSAVILPYDCLGGIPALAAIRQGIHIIAVSENRTVLDVTARKLGLKNVMHAENYLEAAGIVAAMKEGIDYRMTRRPVARLGRI